MSDTPMQFSVDDLNGISYSPEQQRCIAAALEEARTTEAELKGWMRYTWSDRFVVKGNQVFAVFGACARELLRFSAIEDEGAGTRYEYLPVVMGGRMLEESPEEGQSGILYLMRCTHRKGIVVENSSWITAYLGRGWLRTDELELPNPVLIGRLIEEINDGENVLTRAPVGWA